MTINQQSHRCVGERKEVFLPDITRVHGLNPQAGGQAIDGLKRRIHYSQAGAKQAEPHHLFQ